jgi:hypothetical protein
MTDEEMLLTLIHIRRHIRSKHIKAFIKSKIETILKLQEGRQKALASQYHVKYQIPLYGQKICPSVDVIV